MLISWDQCFRFSKLESCSCVCTSCAQRCYLKFLTHTCVEEPFVFQKTQGHIGCQLPCSKQLSLALSRAVGHSFHSNRQQTPRIVRDSYFSPHTRLQLGKENFGGEKKQKKHALFPWPLTSE